VLHRDIKPANLLVDSRGHLWVTDFGLAQMHGGSDLTTSGDLLGTVRYMSPEQAAGRRLLDARTDIYSLGTTLYELLTAQPAFDGRDSQELIRHITFEEPLAPRTLDPEIPRDLETIVSKAMAKEPERRYATARELAEDLERFCDDGPILARRLTIAGRMARWSRRHKRATAVALVGLVIVALASAAGMVRL
jgi:eukaryotic-like serine/threonine-protein kinase